MGKKPSHPIDRWEIARLIHEAELQQYNALAAIEQMLENTAEALENYQSIPKPYTQILGMLFTSEEISELEAQWYPVKFVDTDGSPE